MGRMQGRRARPSTATSRVAERCGVGIRVAHQQWGKHVGGAPPSPPAFAAWRSWDLSFRAGPTTRVHGGCARRGALASSGSVESAERLLNISSNPV
jgi:hypothetical protein